MPLPMPPASQVKGEKHMRNGEEVKSIIDDAFEHVARQAVRGVIADEIGCGIA